MLSIREFGRRDSMDKRYCLVLQLTFALRIWEFYSTYLTLDMDNPGIGLIHFVRKLNIFLLKWTLFLAGPHIYAIQISCQLCSNIDY